MESSTLPLEIGVSIIFYVCDILRNFPFKYEVVYGVKKMYI